MRKCSSCGTSKPGDDPDRLLAAVRYLQQYETMRAAGEPLAGGDSLPNREVN